MPVLAINISAVKAQMAPSAEDGEPKQGEQYGGRSFTQRLDKTRQHRTAGRRAVDSAEDDSHIERE